MKEFITYLISIVITAFVVAIVGIPLPYAFATLVSFILLYVLTGKVGTHIVTKVMPTTYQWVSYAAILLAIVLITAGLVYKSIYCLIFALICLVVCIITTLFERKKMKADKEEEQK